jgi:hypothetical protein
MLPRGEVRCNDLTTRPNAARFGSPIGVGRPSNPGLSSRPHGIDATTAGLAGPETAHPVPTSRGAGQTIDAAIKLFRAQWKTLMAIVAVISVPFTVLQAYVIHATTR